MIKKRTYSICWVFCVLGLLLPERAAAAVNYNTKIPQLVFAAQELNDALKETGKEQLQISLTIQKDADKPEAFQIKIGGTTQIQVIGSDANGAMYGGFEVAERLRIGLPVKNMEHQPFIKTRGVKINIPIDVRLPAFADGGEAAQRNVKTMWDFGFWKEYLDTLARDRYNMVSLWAAHPFSALIKLEEYPDVAMDDIHYIDDIPPGATVDPELTDTGIPGTMYMVKKMPIEEKIKFWQKVFAYAEDRGIEIFMVHWNVFTYGATGKYGITPEQDNPKTIEYIRACVREMLLTYPQIKAIGTCAGENDDEYLRGKFMTENFLFNSYGKAVMDVKKLQSDRDVRFIIRRHSTQYDDFTEAFKDYTGGVVDTSLKYAVAHMYSSRRPQEWEKRIVDEGWLKKYDVWLNLRNDDIFMHRWGSPDYAREFIKWIPREHVPGFYMGSDTYVWGREFISKNPETAGQLEIKKHWYRERLWGQLAYNDELGDDYWAAVLEHHFPGVDGNLLLKAWESVSEVIPQLNRAVWKPTDGGFGAEACRQTSGFLTLDDYYFDRPAMVLNRVENAPDPQCITVTEYAKAYLSGEKPEGLAPPQISENLDGYAEVALNALPALRAQMGNNVELRETLNDIESMAYLGRYYADKMRAATKLAIYREGGRTDEKYIDQSIAHLEDAVEEWRTYASVLNRQYRPQLGARANNQDWDGTLKRVQKEVETVRAEKDFPVLAFENLSNGDKIPSGSDLRVEIKATDGDGPPRVKLRMNGLVVQAEKTADGLYVWSGSSDELLKSMAAGMVHLEAVAVDKNGLSTSAAIDLQVGNASPDSKDAWKDQIHAVILNEGDVFTDEDKRTFPRLECELTLEDDGAIKLKGGNWSSKGRGNRPKWKTMKQPNPYRFHMMLENGQLQVHRQKEGGPKLVIYKTRPVSGPGPFKLGITADRKLVIFRGDTENATIVWRNKQ